MLRVALTQQHIHDWQRSEEMQYAQFEGMPIQHTRSDAMLHYTGHGWANTAGVRRLGEKYSLSEVGRQDSGMVGLVTFTCAIAESIRNWVYLFSVRHVCFCTENSVGAGPPRTGKCSYRHVFCTSAKPPSPPSSGTNHVSVRALTRVRLAGPLRASHGNLFEKVLTPNSGN